MSTENHNQFFNEAFLCIADNKFSSKNILHVCRSGNAIIVHLVTLAWLSIFVAFNMTMLGKYIWLGIVVLLFFNIQQ